MKTKLLALACSLLFLVGCRSPATVRMWSQAAASSGGIAMLEKDPTLAPKLEKTKKALDGVVLLETGTPADIQRAIQVGLGNDPRGEILAANLTAVVQWLTAEVLKLDQRQAWTGFTRPAAEGMSAGLGQALATQKK